MVNRINSAKGPTDLADMRRLLLAFPDLKALEGPVADRLRKSGAPETVLEAWRKIAIEEIVAENDDDGY